MGVSILDAHPNNECLNLGLDEAWFSFIFCGSHINRIDLHAYDYYTGEEKLFGKDLAYEEVPAIENRLFARNSAGNGIRINIREFVKDDSVFDSDGEYTWRAELIQDINPKMGKCPDNMIYEGVLLGEPNIDTKIGNIKDLDLEHYLPLTVCLKDKIKPPYYVDFLDSKYEGEAYDIPVTYDEVRTDSSGNQVTIIQVDTYSSTSENQKLLVRPDIGSDVYVHKKRYYGSAQEWRIPDNGAFIDDKIQGINADDSSDKVLEGCYLKVGSDYFEINSYDKSAGIITCKNGEKLRTYPAGTHYAIYTTRFWTPYYYFRVHKMPSLSVTAEFHERRRLDSKVYDTVANCVENTANGILFNAELTGDPHSTVKYHYWDIFDADTGKLVYHTEKIYSQEMECEVFVPFPYGEQESKKYIGKITVVTQDNITLRGEADCELPCAPKENNEKFSLRAYQNDFGGVELAWNYNYVYDGGTLLKATDFEVFRVDKRLNKVKYLGKVDCSSMGIDGVVPAASGHNWYLIDKDCNFKLKTPNGAKVNMWLVGGGCDGGSWTVTPNEQNKSFAVGQSGGEGGYVCKKTVICDSGEISGSVKIAPRNNTTDTSVTISGTRYKCNDKGCSKVGRTGSITMTQTSGSSVIYNNDAKNGVNGVVTPCGIVGSSGGGGAACGGNRTSGGVQILSVSGITPKYNKGNWILIDRDSLGGESGEFDLSIPEGAVIKAYLVGGGQDGGYFYLNPLNTAWDKSAGSYSPGGNGGYVLTKQLNLDGSVHCKVKIADVNDETGTTLTINGDTYKCNDASSSHYIVGKHATAQKLQSDPTHPIYIPGQNGKTGIETPLSGDLKYVGSSGGGGGLDNGTLTANSYDKRNMPGGKGGIGAGNGATVDGYNVPDGGDAVGYGCGGGDGAYAEYAYSYTNYKASKGGKGMPGCIIFELVQINVPCPDPGKGGVGAGDGGFPNDDGENATNYGCGGGNAGYYAVDSDGNCHIGNVGKGMQGCVILEIDTSGIEVGSDGKKVYAVDWTAASDKEYRYIVTGCNYESAYLGKDSDNKDIRHSPEEMIECSACVDITPSFDEFYLYFLNDADIPVKSEFAYENYDTALTEPLGRYVTSRNNPYKAVKRHMHTLAFERNSKAFYRRHTWRIMGDVEIGEVTHNITRNVNQLYAKMPSVTVQPTDYDSFSLSFLFGYLDCCSCNGEEFVFNDQYMFELWKKCVTEKKTVMIKDPKGNVWTGSLVAHGYNVEYDVFGMPYLITVEFTQTRTEDNTLVMIVDDHNKYLKTVENNHLK